MVLYEPEDDEAAHEDGTRSHPGVAKVQRMRQEVPDQIGTKGAPENKLRRGKELKGRRWREEDRR